MSAPRATPLAAFPQSVNSVRTVLGYFDSDSDSDSDTDSVMSAPLVQPFTPWIEPHPPVVTHPQAVVQRSDDHIDVDVYIVEQKFKAFWKEYDPPMWIHNMFETSNICTDEGEFNEYKRQVLAQLAEWRQSDTQSTAMSQSQSQSFQSMSSQHSVVSLTHHYPTQQPARNIKGAVFASTSREPDSLDELMDADTPPPVEEPTQPYEQDTYIDTYIDPMDEVEQEVVMEESQGTKKRHLVMDLCGIEESQEYYDREAQAREANRLTVIRHQVDDEHELRENLVAEANDAYSVDRYRYYKGDFATLRDFPKFDLNLYLIRK